MTVDTESGKFGLKLLIDQDTDAENPREWDNFGRMVCFHGRYRLGDPHDFVSSDYNSWEELEDAIFKRAESEGDKVAAIFRLSLYDHGGVTIYIGEPRCRFDSGYVGFIYATRNDILKLFHVDPSTCLLFTITAGIGSTGHFLSLFLGSTWTLAAPVPAVFLLPYRHYLTLA